MVKEPEVLEVEREFCYYEEQVEDGEEEVEIILEDDDELIEKELEVQKDLGGYSTRLPTSWPEFEDQIPTDEELKIQQDIDNPSPKGAAWSRHSNGMRLYGHRYWVPESFRGPIMDAIHIQGHLWHPGSAAMMRVLRVMYNWEYMQDSICQYLKTCITCQRIRPPISLEATQKKHPNYGPFETVYMDFWGPCVWRGQQYLLLNMIDFHSKWVETVIIDNKTTEEVTKAFFIHWISRYGAPRILVTDNDPPLVAAELTGLARMLGVTKIRTTPYHPEGNAPVENFHGSLKPALSSLRMYAENVISFQEAIAWILMAYRATPHSALFDSPSFVAHGHEIKLTQDKYLQVRRGIPRNEDRMAILLTVRNELIRRNQLMQRKAAAQPVVTMKRFDLGEMVLVQLTDKQFGELGRITGSRKLISHWSLPMTVIATNHEGTVANLQCKGTGLYLRAHLDRCRRILPPSTKGQILLWDRIIAREKPLLSKIGVRAAPPHSQLPPLPNMIRRNAVRGGINAAQTTSPPLINSTTPVLNGPKDNPTMEIKEEEGQKKKRSAKNVLSYANPKEDKYKNPLYQEIPQLVDKVRELNFETSTNGEQKPHSVEEEEVSSVPEIKTEEGILDTTTSLKRSRSKIEEEELLQKEESKFPETIVDRVKKKNRANSVTNWEILWCNVPKIIQLDSDKVPCGVGWRQRDYLYEEEDEELPITCVKCDIKECIGICNLPKEEEEEVQKAIQRNWKTIEEVPNHPQ
jgi:transposase InsO family protein